MRTLRSRIAGRPSVLLLLIATALPVMSGEKKKKVLTVEFAPQLVVGPPKEAVREQPGLELVSPRVFVPEDSALVSRGKGVTASTMKENFNGVFEGDLSYLTDGQKEGDEGYSLILIEGLHWVQVDLGQSHFVDAVVLWHFFRNYRVVNDVVVQASEDPEFKTGVVTLYNNDADNSAKQGVGTDKPFLCTNKGKQIDGQGTKARYIRCWSNGSTDGKFNEYIEAEVWGRPAH